MGTGTRKRHSTPRRGPSYWLVATNRDTDHWLPWPERPNLSDSIDDVLRVMREIDPKEFRMLLGDDEVAFHIARRYPYDSASETFVWSWTWSESGLPESMLTASAA